MTAYTTPDALPYPDDYAQPADSPSAFSALAGAAQAALTSLRDYVNTKVGLIEGRSVTAGNGLTGGGTLAASRTVNVGAGTGISVAADSVGLNLTYTDARYSAASHNHDSRYYTESEADARYSAASHNHDSRYYTESEVNALLAALPKVKGAVSAEHTLSDGDSGGPYTIAHNLGKTPTGIVATATGDDGNMSIVVSINAYDATNVVCLARNIGGAAETFRISVVAVG